VTGEPYLLPASNPAGGFFTRLRVAERLVIHHGPQQSFGQGACEWMMACVQPDLQPRFAKKSSHA
jgi:hypothetical protein